MMKIHAEISEIQIIPVKPHNGLVAFASFILNNQFYVGNVAIYTSFNERGFRLVYPTKVLPNGKQINCFHPIKKEVGESIQNQVLVEYENILKH